MCVCVWGGGGGGGGGEGEGGRVGMPPDIPRYYVVVAMCTDSPTKDT